MPRKGAASCGESKVLLQKCLSKETVQMLPSY